MSAIIEAFFLCLLASIIWAPIIFFVTTRLSSQGKSNMADKLWPIALVVTALPAIFAPFAAAAGLTLRQTTPLPAMLPHADSPTFIAATIEPALTPAASFNLSAVLEASATLYFYGFLMFLTLGLVRMIWFSYRVLYAYDIDEPKLEAGLENWRLRMNINHHPRYAFTDAVSSVCVHGIFRPTILIPMSLLDRVSLDDAILMGAHEMAHIKRGDTALFALCVVAKAIFWFNPFTQRIAARANLAAEKAADALVIARGAERHQYANCFVQGLRFASGAPAIGQELVPSFTPFDKRSRRERLEAILSKTNTSTPLTMPHKIGLMLSIIAATGLAFAQAALAVAPEAAREILHETPLNGKITMGFGSTNILLGDERPAHEGIDIKAARGTIVRATGDGKVTAATSRYRGQKGWGNVVVIDHGHGLVTRYAHLDNYTVKKGDAVNAGDKIGVVGSTGKSTGPHLHFEVIQNGQAINPEPILAAAPMAATKPVILPDPVLMPDRSVSIVPAPNNPTQSSKSNSMSAPSPKIKTVTTLIEQKLEGQLEFIEKHIADAFGDFETDMDDIGNLEFDFTFSTADGLERVQKWAWLSEKERESFSRAQKEAMESARNAISHAKEKLDRAQHDLRREQRDAERDHERSLREAARAERNAEKMKEKTERARKRIERDFERSSERAEMRAEHYAYQWDLSERHSHNVSEHEILTLKERALERAKADLENELEDIKQQRKKLERKNKKSKNN